MSRQGNRAEMENKHINYLTQIMIDEKTSMCNENSKSKGKINISIQQ